MPRRDSDVLRIGGKHVLPLREEMAEACVDAIDEVIDANWAAIAGKMQLDGAEAAFLEQKVIGRTNRGAASELGWSHARLRNVVDRIRRKIAQAKLSGRRDEFASFRTRSRMSLNPARRELVAGRKVWSLVHLTEENFLNIMRAEHLQPKCLKTKQVRNVLPLIEGQRMQKLDRGFEIKSVSDAGEFTGIASAYDVIDQGDDIVARGAFKKTIQERGKNVPILWSHDTREPIGMGTLTDSDTGLLIRGKLEMELQAARDAYVRIKAGLATGLSIGFSVIRDSIKDNIRTILEAKLFEVSLCVFPMCEQAQVTSVKTMSPEDELVCLQIKNMIRGLFDKPPLTLEEHRVLRQLQSEIRTIVQGATR